MAVNGNRLNVLLVEDSPLQAMVLKASLSREGFIVDLAASLSEALKRLSLSHPDVVLLDLSLPDSSGIVTFERLHENAGAIPVVVLTGLDDENVALNTLKQGAQDYLVKGRPSDESVIRCLQYAIERKRIETQLRDSERKTALIVDNAYDAFISIDEQGEICGWNVQAESTFGWSRQEVLGRTLAETIVPERLRQAHRQGLERVKSGGAGAILNQRVEMSARHKDGHEFPVELAVFAVESGLNRTYCAFVHDITERKALEEKLQSLNAELELRVLARTAELERSNQELQQFAKIAAHDLQEPLRAIQGYVDLLLRRYAGKLDSDGNEFLGFISDGSKRMVQLIQGVLAHCRIKTRQRLSPPVDAGDVLKEVLSNLKAAIDESSATVECDSLPPVPIERFELVQLLQNLLSNAIKFCGADHPRIYVSALRKDGQWLFSIRDNGIGIDQRHAERIFDMFARLNSKSRYSGAGIGLAICKKIVQSYGGEIWVVSQPDQGATFNFTLPVDSTV